MQSSSHAIRPSAVVTVVKGDSGIKLLLVACLGRYPVHPERPLLDTRVPHSSDILHLNRRQYIHILERACQHTLCIWIFSTSSWSSLSTHLLTLRHSIIWLLLLHLLLVSTIVVIAGIVQITMTASATTTAIVFSLLRQISFAT